MRNTVRPLLSAVFVLAASVSGALAAGSLNAYVSGPGVSTNTLSGAIVDGLNTYATGPFTTLASTAITSPQATFTSSLNAAGGPRFAVNDIYAASTSSGNYLIISPGNSVTLSFNTPVPYVGLDFSAVDANNRITFYDAGGSVIGVFDAGRVTALLPNSTTATVKSIDGANTYVTGNYYGQPGNRANNPNEAYSYLHFVGQNGTTISRVTFSQTAGGNLEMDNPSILTTVPTISALGSFVSVGAVPEPATTALVGVGCAGLAVFARRRARRAVRR